MNTTRSPPYLTIGITFICLILAYGCWSYSSQNGELSKFIADLQNNIELSNIKHSELRKDIEALHIQINRHIATNEELGQKAEEYEGIAANIQEKFDLKDNELIAVRQELEELKQKNLENENSILKKEKEEKKPIEKHDTDKKEEATEVPEVKGKENKDA